MFRILLVATALFVAACTAPYTLPANDRADIAKRIAGFERAFVNGDTTEVVNVVPPRMIPAAVFPRLCCAAKWPNSPVKLPATSK